MGVTVALSFASAAGLALDGGVVTSVAASHPCPSSLTVTPSGSGATSSSVVVTGTAPCAGRTLGIAVQAGATVRQGTATAEADGATAVDLDGAYAATSVTGAAATVDGWALPASWTFSPLPAVSCRVYDHPSATCSVVVSNFTFWGYPSTTHFQLDLQVVGNHNANNQHWELSFNFADTFYPFVPRGVQSNGGLVLQTGCSALPVMTVRGNPGWAGPYDQIRSGETRAVYLQGYLGSGGNLLTCP